MSESVVPAAKAHPRKKLTVVRAILGFLVVAIALTAWQRQGIWLWYCASQVERTTAEEQVKWLHRLADGGERAIPAMVNILRKDDDSVCQAAKTALEESIGTTSADNPLRLVWVKGLVAEFASLSQPGQVAVLDWFESLMKQPNEELKTLSNQLVEASLASSSSDVRVRTVALILRAELNCLDRIVPLMGDENAHVRRAAILALGPVREGQTVKVSDDDLLKSLHDTDMENRRLCEISLRSRGRSPRDIELGRLYSAPQPAERLMLLTELSQEEELDVTVWLERLLSDEDPAVRAGSARVASIRQIDLTQQLQKMSQNDPSASVRRIAAFYRDKMLLPH
jgi:HEAT repeat protein